MKKIVAIALLIFAFSASGFNQVTPSPLATPVVQNAGSKIGIVISSNDPETVWNAFRFANFSCQKGDSVSVFLLGKGVESQTLKDKSFDVVGMMESYVSHGGRIFTCGTCLKSRKAGGTELCPISTMADMYAIVNQSDKLLTF
jgi:sulfur relay (sulfurtransferase) complex TusBCD TusD component (DsrE family)